MAYRSIATNNTGYGRNWTCGVPAGTAENDILIFGGTIDDVAATVTDTRWLYVVNSAGNVVNSNGYAVVVS